MRTPAVILAALILLGSLGCSDTPLPLGPSEKVELNQARARWNSSGLSSYTVESRFACCCAAHLHLWTRLTVRNGVVVSAEPLAPLPANITSKTDGWRTVPELFSFIDEAGRGKGQGVENVSAVYDASLGYPEEISTRCGANIADCGSSMYLRSLVAAR